MIVPGTYIDVRAEGLISAGRIATGIVGVVGTASAGPVGVPVTLSGFANAREVFGLPDDFDRPVDGANPLTLTRALQQLYANGASTVIGVRVAKNTARAATYAVKDDADRTVATLTSVTPGTWGNGIQISVGESKAPARVTGERQTSSFAALGYRTVRPSPENRLQITRGDTKRVDTLDIVYRFIARGEEVVANGSGAFILANPKVANVPAVNVFKVVDASGNTVRTYGSGAILYGAGTPPQAGELRVNTATGELTFEATQKPSAGQKVIATYGVEHAAPQPGQVLITVWNADLDFHASDAPNAGNGDVLTASYLVEPADAVLVTLVHEQIKETYVVADGRLLAQQLATSRLVRATAHGTYGGNKPAVGASAYFGTGTNTRGANGSDAGEDEYRAGLEAISNQLINIVVLAGQNADDMGSVLVGHLRETAETDFERIGVIGAKGDTVPEFLGHSVAEDRVILVAPGIRFPDGKTLPAAYTAAAVAGLVSSLSVQTSLTNKSLNIPGLAVDVNRGQQEQLIRRNVLTVVRKEGLRVLKGVTTQGEGQPFSSIPIRRIVDYAKYGVRSAANPYIGKLNNSRVRSALRATLDAFLTRMVEDEALTAYELEVTATRAQEIAGEVAVTMTIQPTFSIDYIRVTMTLK
ncbi:MAG TPA: phage tail sheath C-terminal domain-containing protein [Myxococcaceae bacterium]|nr:phage tail sheath C-terminal domain-containing protein [Myxococcaceae bacterium]